MARFQELGIVLALFVMCTFLAVRSPYFLTLENLLNVLRQISVVGIVAVGEALVIISGGIDLSVGSILALCGVSTALLIKSGLNFVLAGLVGIGIGAFVGAVNGVLVVKGRIAPFIVTLGMLSIARGITYLLTGGMPTTFESPLALLGSGYILGVPVSVIVMFIVVFWGHAFATRTVTGRYVFAVGDNERAARLSAIKVDEIKMFVYIVSGCLSALAGIILAGNLYTADTAAGVGLELDAIAAAVIGGASLAGGQGSIFGVLIGSALMGVLRNGFVLLGVSAYWQTVTIGLVIIGSVAIDHLRKRE
ncbi:MAG: ABC transporter permease [Thermoanaerobacteraceae bacterium]|nr:ABC transporter permease [Thermoanaerobacteraceae bacterium]